jgi:histidine triad (HIT) family protein
MAYDPDNIFAKILRGELPCHKVYEDDRILAFLDIMPRTEGHTLVVPKGEATDLFDIAPDDLANLMQTVQKLAPKIRDAVGADGVLIQQFNGAAAGQTVFHIHVHIVPVKEGVPLGAHAGTPADQAALAALAEKIRGALAA